MSITTALKARREQLSDREAGFTLIELLVVVIIIGILAAIAIPIYLNVQNNAKDSAVKSDLTNLKTAVVAWTQDNASATALPAFTALGPYGYSQSAAYGTSGTPAAATGSTPTTFCVSATSVTSKTFSITSSGAVTQAACGASSTW